MNFSLGIDIGGTSVKAAAVVGGVVRMTDRKAYGSGVVGLDDVRAAIGAACLPMVSRYGPPATVGLCLPGLFDRGTRAVVRSVNLPSLVGIGVDALVVGALPMAPAPSVFTDAHAAAFDGWTLEATEGPEGSGRWFMLSLGTGVGASVLDDGEPLRVSGESPGHFGQLDVSGADGLAAPIGPDGGRGSLEGYIGVPAICRRHGCSVAEAVERVLLDDAALGALVRALRIAHAIYRPEHVRLLGGVGIRLGSWGERLRVGVDDGLSSIAKRWSLGFGSTDFHAACGAGKLGMRG